MPQMRGNKGEWSEVYVLLKLLADGKLYAADSDLNKIPDEFYPIIKILRKESVILSEYVRNGNITIFDETKKKLVTKVPIEFFAQKAEELLENLKHSQGRSFTFPETEKFLRSINCNTVTADRIDKSDITVVVHDLRTGLKPTLGFSIKSMLGQNSTLFNPGNATNFIYKIEGKNTQKIDIKEVNALTEESKITTRLEYLLKRGFEVKFHDIQSKNFRLNLQLIDSSLPQIMAYLLLYKYTEKVGGGGNLKSLLKIMEKKNPLGFDPQFDHPFYEYKIKSFLTDAALGMTPSHVWTGVYNATGGIIFVKNDGDVICYHIYNRKDFQEYLINNTKLEQAGTGRYQFGDLYKEKGEIFIKLNLQIRFT